MKSTVKIRLGTFRPVRQILDLLANSARMMVSFDISQLNQAKSRGNAQTKFFYRVPEVRRKACGSRSPPEIDATERGRR
jgi:hypothetical protein